MPHFILKPEPDKDLYVLWSTITEVPYYVGTRDQCKEKLTSWREGPEVADDERFDRADQRGTSSFDGLDGWDEGKTTGSVIVEQRGLVQLKDLPEVYRCMQTDESYDHVVIPFEVQRMYLDYEVADLYGLPSHMQQAYQILERTSLT